MGSESSKFSGPMETNPSEGMRSAFSSATRHTGRDSLSQISWPPGHDDATDRSQPGRFRLEPRRRTGACPATWSHRPSCFSRRHTAPLASSQRANTRSYPLLMNHENSLWNNYIFFNGVLSTSGTPYFALPSSFMLVSLVWGTRTCISTSSDLFLPVCTL